MGWDRGNTNASYHDSQPSPTWTENTGLCAYYVLLHQPVLETSLTRELPLTRFIHGILAVGHARRGGPGVVLGF